MHYEGKLTKQHFHRDMIIVFSPTSKEEARFIKDALQKFEISTSNFNVYTNILSVYNGMLYSHFMHTGSQSGNTIFCTADQLKQDYVSPQEKFNALAKKVDKLEELLEKQNKMIETLYNHSNGGFNKGGMFP